MKRRLSILVLLAVLLTGCGQNPNAGAPATGGQAQPADSGYSNSAPAKMLETPDKARDAVQEANERAKAAQEALPR